MADALQKLPEVEVIETFFSVEVTEMARATAFYVSALGAAMTFTSPAWSSLNIAGVRIGLALSPEGDSRRIGLHFAVRDLAVARAAVESSARAISQSPARRRLPPEWSSQT